MRMWSLQNLLFTLCIVLSCVTSAVQVIHSSGYEGREANVSCSYGEGYESYQKYFCKNDCGSDDDVLITTTEKKKGRYSIYDDKGRRVFTTTISDLSLTDAGKYWCGVSRSGKDIYTEVRLEVGQDTCCGQSTKVQSYETGSVSFNCPYKSQYQENLKYICRGNQPSTCLQQAVVTSDKQQNGQFRLTDDKESRKFTVTITNLTQRDSGSYLCGVHINTGLDVFSAVEVEVKEWCCVKTSKLSGTVGRQVNMQCPYPPQHRDNRKFLCKGDHRNNCADMVTNGSRFTLQDDVASSSFLVMITELKAGDAGTYWCGSDSQWSANNYTKIQLSVVLETSTVISTIAAEDPVESETTHTPGNYIKDAAHFHPVVFIGPPILILMMMIILGIVCKYKCHKVTRAGVNMKMIKTRAVEEEEDVQDDYENQDVVVCSKQGTFKPQRSYNHYDDADTCCGQSTKVQSYETGSVSFSCPYKSQYQENLKYICRGNQLSTCLQQAVVTSDKQQNGQFRLTDDKESRKFTVTIINLTQMDSGSYLCGIHRNTGLDVFLAVEVEVKGCSVGVGECCVKTSKLSGIVGHQVNMQCPYPPQHRGNRKFLCKGDHHNNCTNMVTNGSRFTLQDDVASSSFLVMITELKAGDAGTYWCGSDSQWSANNYTKIQLSVGTEVTMDRNRTKSAEEEDDVQDDYENQDIVVCSEHGTSKPQCSYNNHDDAVEDQQDSVYQNLSTTEDIY
ncbi:CMRF35-like molecule 5 [Larimichthys crocea]|uniref:CMRF35-like molecule 5 n=1 Tax=Larimichthys crocea TaxID=215358 RepID=A0A6G0JBK4_LARCR|nr:CMRF35-like molecule 5 [Larimichthys crocea]